MDISLTVSPIIDGDGRIIGASKVARDITQQKRAAEALRDANEQLSVVTDNMAVAVTRCDRDFRYLWVSRGFAEWMGRAVDEIVGRTIPEVMGVVAFETVRPHITRVLSGEPVEFETQVPYRNLGARWIKAGYVPTHDAAGETDGWVAVITDTTEQRKMEDALRQADRRKDEFLADARARAAQSARADPQRAAHPAHDRRARSDDRARRRDHGAAGQAHRAARGRPARRLAHHARQDRAAQGAGRARAPSSERPSRRAGRSSKAAATSSRSRFRRSPLRSTPIRCGWRRCSRTCLNNAAKYTDDGRADLADGPARRRLGRDLRPRQRHRAFRARCSRASSSCSRRSIGARTARKAVSASA